MSFYQDHCIYLPSMLGWFTFSALLSAFNKLVFGDSHLGFPCPLLLTSVHFLVQWIFSWTLSEWVAPEYFGGDLLKQMDWKTFLSVSIPCGLVTSGDVGLSNLSLVSITITFYTMVKASAPVFVLLWAYVFGIERITSSLLLVVALIASGEVLTVWGEVDFNFIGFITCLSATVLSGARWTLVQLKLNQLDPPLKTTIATMRVLSPCMFGSMFVFSMAIEQPWNALRGGHFFDTPGHALYTVALGLGGASLAICMVLFEFSLIMNSNAIVLMIGGVIKEMLTIMMGVLVFGDALNPTNVAGIFIVFLGVVCYKVTFHLAKLEEAEQLDALEEEEIQLEETELKEQIKRPNGSTKRHGTNRTKYQRVEHELSFQEEPDGSAASLFVVEASPLQQEETHRDTVAQDDKQEVHTAIGNVVSEYLQIEKEEHREENGIV